MQASIPLLAEDVDTDAEAEEVLNELNLLTEIEESPPGSIHLEMNSSEWSKSIIIFIHSLDVSIFQNVNLCHIHLIIQNMLKFAIQNTIARKFSKNYIKRLFVNFYFR